MKLSIAMLTALLAALACSPASAAVRSAEGNGLVLDEGLATVTRRGETRHPMRVIRRDLERAVSAGRPLFLPSTDGAPLLLSEPRLRRRADGISVVTGTVSTAQGTQSAVLTLGSDATFGLIPQRAGPALRIETKGGRAWLVENDAPVSPQGIDFFRVPPPTAAQRDQRRRQDVAKALGTPNVDVLVLYTPTLARVWGSDAAMRTRVAHLEAITNQAYVDSEVDQTITVVGSYMVDYVNTDDNGEALDLMTDGGGKMLPQVASRLRDMHGADLVALLREFDRANQTTCGVGWIGGYDGAPFVPHWGFSVSADHGFGEDHCGEWTFAHELGHNMGAHHDFDTAEGEYGAYTYSRGFRRTLDPTSGFATVMAYSEGPQVRLGQFSNPRLSRCLGQPCGDAITADNARGMSQSAPAVASLLTPPSSPLPALQVSDVVVAEGNAGTKAARFTLSLSSPATSQVSATVLTYNGTAIETDYTPTSAIVTIPVGQSSATFDVTVLGDIRVERDELFSLDVISVTGARIADAQGVATIVNDEPIPKFTLNDVHVHEGDSGLTALTFAATLSAPSTSAVTFDVDISEYSIDAAIAPDDYIDRSWDGLIIPAGSTGVQFTVEVVGDTLPEPNERIRIVASALTGAEIARDWARGWILDDDDTAGVADLVAREDRFEVIPGVTTPLAVLTNDWLGNDGFDGGSLQVTYVTAGGTTSTTVAAPFESSAIAYRPAPGFFGEEAIGYRACEAPPTSRCIDGRAVAVVRPAVDVEPWSESGVAGWAAVAGTHDPVPGEPDRFAAAYASTPLVAPETFDVQVYPDVTPESPWDPSPYANPAMVRTLPAPPGAPTTWIVRVEVEPGASPSEQIDVYLGVDHDQGQDVDHAEVQCTAAMRVAVPDRQVCEMRLVHPGTGVTRYWVLPHDSYGGGARVRGSIYEVPLIPGDGSLTVTGPGLPARDAPIPMRVAWSDPTHLFGRRAGYVGARMHPGKAPVWFPVVVTRADDTSAALALHDAAPLTLALAPNESQTRLFFDVPEGASQLTVTTTSDRDIDVYVARDATPSSPQIAAAPPIAQAAASAATASGNETIMLSGAVLAPGRWYVVPTNVDDLDAALQVRVDVVATAVPPRPGSYFDAARSGHGLFLYPAGSSWAGLWYTYFEDATPTWYYLQGAAPGADGLWTGELYRTMWNGSAQTPTKVGTATVTPTGADAFVFTWSIDGETGSEPMAALGRGCPMLGAQPVDVSSHWFNPATSGTGHSVQLWSDYEFYASFVYDAAGVPRFLTAENAGFGGADATFPIDQLTGFCPLCTRPGAPLRQTVGTLRRTISGGTLATLGVTATFAGDVAGTWLRDEAVQALGGPGTTQGCAP